MEVKFKAYSFVKGEYRHTSDAKPSSAFDKEDILASKGVSAKILVRDWFGTYTNVIFTISNVEIDEYNDVIYTVSTNNKIPERFFASPSDILRGQDYIYPVSYSRIKN